MYYCLPSYLPPSLKNSYGTRETRLNFKLELKSARCERHTAIVFVIQFRVVRRTNCEIRVALVLRGRSYSNRYCTRTADASYLDDSTNSTDDKKKKRNGNSRNENLPRMTARELLPRIPRSWIRTCGSRRTAALRGYLFTTRSETRARRGDDARAFSPFRGDDKSFQLRVLLRVDSKFNSLASGSNE